MKYIIIAKRASFSLSFFLTLVVITLLSSCQSVPEEIPPGISQREVFQRAQEYVDALNYDAAIFYLTEFKNRFPEDIANQLAAEYQLALIEVKRNQNEQATGSFLEIIETYEAAPQGTYPEWIIVLSRKLYAELTES